MTSVTSCQTTSSSETWHEESRWEPPTQCAFHRQVIWNDATTQVFSQTHVQFLKLMQSSVLCNREIMKCDSVMVNKQSCSDFTLVQQLIKMLKEARTCNQLRENELKGDGVHRSPAVMLRYHFHCSHLQSWDLGLGWGVLSFMHVTEQSVRQGVERLAPVTWPSTHTENGITVHQH